MDTRSGRIAAKFVAWGVAIATVGLALCAEAATYRVTADAAGGGDGQSWASPMTLDEALTATAGGGEILMKAETFTVTSALTFAPTAEVAIRGGYDGTDGDSFSSDARTTLDGATAVNILTLKNTAAVTFERMVFARAYAHALVKSLAGDLTIRDGSFLGNGRSLGDNKSTDCYGRAIVAGGASTARLVVSNVLFGGNMLMNGRCCGQGGAVQLQKLVRATFDDCAFVTNGVSFYTSRTAGFFSGQVPCGSALYASACPVTMRRCRFAGNGAEAKTGDQGGCVVLVGASGDSAFTNCVWLGNNEVESHTPSSAYNGGALAVYLNATASRVSVKNCTFAYNISAASHSAGGLNVRRGTVDVCDSIVYGNMLARDWQVDTGCDISVQASGVLNMTYTCITSNDAAHVSCAAGGTLNLDADSVKVFDPQFVTTYATAFALTTVDGNGVRSYGPFSWGTDSPRYGQVAAFDAHLLSSAGYCVNGGATGPVTAYYSSAVDAGDPTAPYAGEPTPNGSRVNMGGYGNTVQASRSNVGTPKVDSFAVTAVGGLTRPQAAMTLGVASGTDFNATVIFSCVTGGVEVARQTRTEVHAGVVPTWVVPRYFPQGTVVTIAYEVSVVGAPTLSSSQSITLDGDVPAMFGKGGGPTVLHVRAGSDCEQNGANWLDAYPTIEEAFAAAAKEGICEIWIAGGPYQSYATLATAKSIAVRGGFTGLENTAAERSAGSFTTIDNGNNYHGLIFENAADTTAELDRLVFTRMTDHGFTKTGAGGLVVRDCRFLANARSNQAAGRGFWASGSSTATLVVSNCDFEGNMNAVADHRFTGLGGTVHAETFARATFDDCLFATNGMHLCNAYNYGTLSGYDRSCGSAVYLKNCPVTMRACRFAGNCTEVHTADSGGCVYLEGACGGSAFTNCAFVGNAEWHRNFTEYATLQGGGLVIALGTSDATVTVQNCTFAYNYSSGEVGAGLHVFRGTVVLRDSILYGNTNSRAGEQLPTLPAEISVRDAGVLAADHVLVWATNGILRTEAATVHLDEASLVVGDPLFETDLSSMTNLIVMSKRSGEQYGGVSRPVYNWNPACYAELATVNVHVQGSRGYTDEKTGRLVRHPGKDSPAIDAGHPASDVSREAADCHGGHGPRVNLGVYGNTPWATRTAAPATLVVR